MADEEDVVVNIEDAAPADETPVVADAPSIDPAIQELKNQYNELQKKTEDREARLESERNARIEAERRAAQARQEAEAARSEVTDSQSGQIESGISAAQAEASAAEQANAAALEAGNYAEAAKAQRRIASAEAKLVWLEEAKANIEVRKAQPRIEQRQQEPPADPVEAYISGPLDDRGTRRSDITQSWLRAHKDWITDSRKNAKLTSAHWAAVSEGLSPDTDDYFAHIETAIGLRQAANGNGQVTVRQHTRRAAAPVAPVSAGAGGGVNGGSSNTVTLTKGEAETATDGSLTWNYNDPKGKFKKGEPIGVQEFARRKLAMMKQGKYDKINSET